MPVSASDERGVQPRLAAVRLVHAVVDEGRSLADAMPAQEAELGGADRALARELAYGSLRWHGRLAALADTLLARPLKRRDRILKSALEVGLYQLLETRIPPHAAVSATVAVARALDRPWAARVLNGCLRRFQREGERLLRQLDRDPAVASSMPGWLNATIAADWPLEQTDIRRASLARPPMTLRVNRRQGDRADYLQALIHAGFTARPVAGLADALTLDRPVAVGELPDFDSGRVSVQDAAAQFAAKLLAVSPGARVLDACAAPGGKAAHLLECEPEQRLLALDVDGERLDRVGETLERLGLQAALCIGDAAEPGAWWDGEPFTHILVDAPCSGTGVIRRHPDIKWLRRGDDIPRLATGQMRLLRALWPLLAAGGRLVYATCSILRAENEAVAAAFAAETPDAVAVAPALPVGRSTGVGHQILPGERGMDGFYYACFDKR